MINLSKKYLDYVKFVQHYLYCLQNIVNPEWRDYLNDNLNFYIVCRETNIPDIEGCRILNCHTNVGIEECIDIINKQTEVKEIVYLRIDLVTFTLVKENFILLYDNIIFVFNFDFFSRSKQPRKIMVSKFWVENNSDFKVFQENKDFIKNQVLYNIVFIPEVSDTQHLNLIKSIDLPNTIFIGQKINFKNAINIEFHFWFINTIYVNIKSPTLFYQIKQIETSSSKNLYFDCLFGTVREWREYLYHLIFQNKINEKCLITTKNWPNKENTFSIHKQIELPIRHSNKNIEFLEDKKNNDRFILNNANAADQFILDNISISICQVIDIDIYQQTAYSLIFETHCDDFSDEDKTILISEKICKPMLAKRLFLVCAVPGYLKHVQELGFKTFDGIIDESYDEIQNHNMRLNAVFTQMKNLLELDQKIILNKIKPIVDYNYNHLFHLLEDENLIYLLEHWK